jgi:hypothetical protein
VRTISALASGSSPAVGGFRNKLREMGACYIVPAYLGENVGSREFKLLCIRAIGNLVEKNAQNLERIKSFDTEAAIAKFMHAVEDDEQAFGEAKVRRQRGKDIFYMSHYGWVWGS